jgi:hypothetical protein
MMIESTATATPIGESLKTSGTSGLPHIMQNAFIFISN